MEELFQLSMQIIRNTKLKTKRYLYAQIDWKERLIGIIGPRGTGKTTLMLQFLKENFYKSDIAIYVSLDDLYFSSNSLTDFARKFVAYGGKYLFLDEVHKYKNWSAEIKKIYDFFPELKIVFSASSILQIYKGQADLSRRVALYYLPVLSFREFLEFYAHKKFKVYKLDEILRNHISIATEISEKIKPLKFFQKYLDFGAYPFFKEGLNKYKEKLKQAVLQIFENDVPYVISISFKQIKKLKTLMYVISTSAPFIPNIKKLSELTSIDRKQVYQYLDLLERAGLIINLRQPTVGISAMRKPEKIFLDNTNLIKIFAENSENKGTLRETFFVNQLKNVHKVYYTPKTDFLVDDKYLFEIGGKTKTRKQIAGQENAFVIADDIEIGFGNKIPLWLFGFLY